MKLWKVVLVVVGIYVGLVLIIQSAIQDTRTEYNVCRDKGGEVVFCLTGFK